MVMPKGTDLAALCYVAVQVKAMESGWGRALYQNLLIRNIAAGVYKVIVKYNFGLCPEYCQAVLEVG